MSGFDVGRVTYSYQGAAAGDEAGEAALELNPGSLTARQAHYKFVNFIRQFTSELGPSGRRTTYSTALDPEAGQIAIDVQHVKSFDSVLGENLEARPAEMLPVLESVVHKQLEHLHNVTGDAEAATSPYSSFQVTLYSSTEFGPRSLRAIASDHVSQLVSLPGIVTAASRPKHKATTICIRCSSCGSQQTLHCRPGMGGAVIPGTCTAGVGGPAGTDAPNCPAHPFVMLPEQSTYVDQQTLKLQERPEDVPTGELPRTVMLCVDRKLVARVAPGTRVNVVGVYSIFDASREKAKSKQENRGAVAIRHPYIRVLGIEAADNTQSRNRPTFTPEEEQRFQTFSRTPGALDSIYKLIAPQIYGSENVKKALASLLFGGARKKLPDGTFRRGDVNVLLLGDPSTAKSQLLKFAAKVAPIAVYTSGKGSSAAGLTASVVRDSSTREFYLEGGAMVLADNGVVCIDEFDKMRPEDRVAIHEAMEQQTISIAKAGITTMLTSRCSVLAAANPPSGRYDDMQSAEDNIDMQTTILSRFDLIFIVKDERSRERDMEIAHHVLRLHQQASRPAEDAAAEEEEQFLRRYILYCRTKCHPRLSEEASGSLASEYVKIRGKVREAKHGNDSAHAIPITVRQLEALVRVSESLARIHLMTEVKEEHVQQAIDLFNASTLDAIQSGLHDAANLTDEQKAEITVVEHHILRRLAIGAAANERKLVEECVRVGLNETLVRRALVYMAHQGQLEYRAERKIVKRIR